MLPLRVDETSFTYLRTPVFHWNTWCLGSHEFLGYRLRQLFRSPFRFLNEIESIRLALLCKWIRQAPLIDELAILSYWNISFRGRGRGIKFTISNPGLISSTQSWGKKVSYDRGTLSFQILSFTGHPSGHYSSVEPYANGRKRKGFFCLFVCLFVCLFLHFLGNRRAHSICVWAPISRALNEFCAGFQMGRHRFMGNFCLFVFFILSPAESPVRGKPSFTTGWAAGVDRTYFKSNHREIGLRLGHFTPPHPLPFGVDCPQQQIGQISKEKDTKF